MGRELRQDNRWDCSSVLVGVLLSGETREWRNAMKTEIDWRNELDRSFAIEEPIAVGRYVARGHRALRHRRTFTTIVAAATLVAATMTWAALPALYSTGDAVVAGERSGASPSSPVVTRPSRFRTASPQELETMPDGVPVTLPESGDAFIVRPGWRVDRSIESNGEAGWTARWAIQVVRERSETERWVTIDWLAYSTVALNVEAPGQRYAEFEEFAADVITDYGAP
jgi:hypothetical protein